MYSIIKCSRMYEVKNWCDNILLDDVKYEIYIKSLSNLNSLLKL